jgi:hypothetical protein
VTPIDNQKFTIDWSDNVVDNGNTSLTIFTSGIANAEGTFGSSSKNKEWVADGFEPHKPGDVNKDGSVTMADVIKILSYILGENPDGFDVTAADLNGDGKVTITDASILIVTYGLKP